MRFATVLTLIAVVCGTIGCGATATPRPEAGPISGKVTFSDGSALTAAMLELRPLDDTGAPASFSLDANGEFKGDARPGKYTWLITTDGVPAADKGKAEGTIRNVPDAFREGSMERTIDVAGGATFALTVQR